MNFLKDTFKSVASAVQKYVPGETIPINDRNVKITRQLGEGGYAFVYKVVDTSTGEKFALKRVLCHDQSACKAAEKEITVMRRLASQHIIGCIGACKKKVGANFEYYILMELCRGGTIWDMIKRANNCEHKGTAGCECKMNNYLSEKVLLFNFEQICQGIKKMHTHKPPIAHRDLKIENVLLTAKGACKLCDFGSSTTRVKAYTTKEEMAKEEEQIDKHSTLMYRAPEMADLYKKQVK